MTDSAEARQPLLAADEKLTPVMIYTANSLIRGGVITKENIRVSIWMRAVGVPEFIHLKNAAVLIFGPTLQSQNFSDYFVPTAQIIAMHLLPPNRDPLDYDESEANRKMEPVTVLIGSFRFNCFVRMSAQSDLANYLSIARNPWMSLYDIEITNPNIQAMGALRVPFALVRHALATFGSRA